MIKAVVTISAEERNRMREPKCIRKGVHLNSINSERLNTQQNFCFNLARTDGKLPHFLVKYPLTYVTNQITGVIKCNKIHGTGRNYSK